MHGLFLNPGATQLIDDYVDKSLLIREINNAIRNKSDMLVCVSRPRRFGKTIAANMLALFFW
ncbi:MAG: AAA family ATPase [Candidatus Ornithospirochaeta sp.]|nr:AAA family ATPase [Candidatus Ornithospirochaeta sp.]